MFLLRVTFIIMITLKIKKMGHDAIYCNGNIMCLEIKNTQCLTRFKSKYGKDNEQGAI